MKMVLLILMIFKLISFPKVSAKDKDLNKNIEKTKSIQLIENF